VIDGVLEIRPKAARVHVGKIRLKLFNRLLRAILNPSETGVNVKSGRDWDESSVSSLTAHNSSGEEFSNRFHLSIVVSLLQKINK